MVIFKQFNIPSSASDSSDSVISNTTSSSTDREQVGDRISNGRYPRRHTDQRDRDFNYYKQTSLTFYSEHGPGIICLACETSKYLLAQYAKKSPKFRVHLIMRLTLFTGINLIHSLERHRYVHSANKQFSCNDCSQTFAFSSELDRHKALHKTKKKTSSLRLNLFTCVNFVPPYLVQ